MTITEKPKEDRVKETVEILRNIASLGIPLDAPEVTELRGHLTAYCEDGVCWSGNIDFLRFGRIAEVDLPRRADKAIQIKLRIPKASR